MTGDVTSRQIVPKSPACPEGLFLMDGIEGLRSLPKHSVDMLLTDPPYGTTRNFWDVPLPLPELWEAVKWAVKPDGAVLFFAQCPYDKVLGASNTRPGEVVADICAGSGTTAVAALNTGRCFVCFESAPAFYGPATERIRRAREAVASGGKGE